MIINEGYEVLVTINRGYWKISPYIDMGKLSGSFAAMFSFDWEWFDRLFCLRAGLTIQFG